MIVWIGWTVLAFLILFTLCTRCTKSARMLDRLPGPFAPPIIGNIYYTLLDGEGLFMRVREVNYYYRPLFRFWIMHICSVNICLPDHIEAIVGNSRETEKSMIYKYLHPWLGTGLVAANGSKWQKRRKILSPAFHSDILKHFFNTIYENTQNFVEMLKTEGQGEPIVKDLEEIVGDYALNVICETAMGISMKNKDAEHVKYLEAVKNVSQFVTYRLLRPWYHYDFIFNLTSKGRSQRKSLKILHGFTEKIIAERKRYHKSTDGKYLENFDTMTETSANSDAENYINSNNVSVRKRRLALLDLLISASLKNNEIDDTVLREEVDTFTFGAHDTVTLSVSYALLLLAKHKDIQERVREEVDAVMRETNNKPTVADLPKLSYVERCLKESLRLYPSVPIISRTLNYDLQLGKFTIPAGAMCHIHTYEVHRDPDYWPNPLVYDPDRFLPENIKDQHPYAFLPFSKGLRNCIGQRFAMMEMKLLIAFILHNFVLEPVFNLEDIRIQLDMVLRPSCPLPLKFIPIR